MQTYINKDNKEITQQHTKCITKEGNDETHTHIHKERNNNWRTTETNTEHT